MPEDRFVVGWIGRMTAVKRVPDVLEAFRTCASAASRRRSASSARAPTARGRGARARARARCAHCLFVGYQRDVAPYYAFFDALLLPSANEGTPVVAIEALAAALPVVATPVGGVADVVEDGVDGFLVARGDVEALAERLHGSPRDPELRARMGAAGAERVPERYAVERLVDDMDALYRELLTEAGLPQPAVAATV